MIAANENLSRRVAGYKGVARAENIFPSSEIKREFHGFRSKVTEFLCGCVTKEYLSGISVRAGCRNHGDVLRYKCQNCGKSFEKKNLLKEHRWSHAI